MEGEWPTMTLREANVTLIDCDQRTPPAANSGYPYVATPLLRGGRLGLSDARRITREHFLEWTRKAKPSADDVILSRRCMPGETAVAPSDLEFARGRISCCFVRMANPLLVKMGQNERESRTLAALCDALLPKLISGELGVNTERNTVEANA